MRIGVHVQPWRPPFHAAQEQIPHRIEADRASLQCVIDGMGHFLDGKGLHESKPGPQQAIFACWGGKHLHILARSVFLQPCFEQAPQWRETLRQLPANERRCLIQRSSLLFEQGEIVQRIEDHDLAFITTLVARDDFTAARYDQGPPRQVFVAGVVMTTWCTYALTNT